MALMAQEIRINVRTTAQIKRDLEVTAKLRGLTVSALVNSLVVRAIREEKNAEPEAFVKPAVSNGIRRGRIVGGKGASDTTKRRTG